MIKYILNAKSFCYVVKNVIDVYCVNCDVLKNNNGRLEYKKKQSEIAKKLIYYMVNKKKPIYNKDNLSIQIGKYGKPYIEHFFFNVAHSGDWVVGAIATNNIGIDIEKHKKRDFDISKNFFSKNEQKYIIKCSDVFKGFYDVWVAKESYMKAIGMGFYKDMISFELDFSYENWRVSSNNKYVIQSIDIDSIYSCAVCSIDKTMGVITYLEINEVEGCYDSRL